jgi:hypothetical protein
MSWNTNKNENENDDTVSKYALLKEQMLSQIKDRIDRERTYINCAVTGLAKVGKTGIALDCRTEEEIKEGKKVMVLDWDNGAEPTWGSCHDRDENIIIFTPIQRNNDGTSNWDAAFENSHAFLRYCREEIENGNVKAVILDGLDKAYEASAMVLRQHLVKSGKRDGSVIHDTDAIRVSPLDWGIRNQIYNRLLDDFMDLNCDRYTITHMKPVYGDIVNPTPIGEVPDWHKTTPARFVQMIHIDKRKVNNVTQYYATLNSSKTRPDLVGNEWIIFTTNGENEWFGIPEIREGNL